MAGLALGQGVGRGTTSRNDLRRIPVGTLNLSFDPYISFESRPCIQILRHTCLDLVCVDGGSQPQKSYSSCHVSELGCERGPGRHVS